MKNEQNFLSKMPFLSVGINRNATFFNGHTNASAILPQAPVGGGGTQGGGGKCKVLSGSNKGKTGTFTTETTDDGDINQWCEGDWGGTQCGTNGTSNGKCAAARMAPTVSRAIYSNNLIIGW